MHCGLLVVMVTCTPPVCQSGGIQSNSTFHFSRAIFWLGHSLVSESPSHFSGVCCGSIRSKIPPTLPFLRWILVYEAVCWGSKVTHAEVGVFLRSSCLEPSDYRSAKARAQNISPMGAGFLGGIRGIQARVAWCAYKLNLWNVVIAVYSYYGIWIRAKLIFCVSDYMLVW